MPNASVRRIFLDVRDAYESFSAPSVSVGVDLISAISDLEVTLAGRDVCLTGTVRCDTGKWNPRIEFCSRTGGLRATHCSCEEKHLCGHAYALIRALESSGRVAVSPSGLLDISEWIVDADTLAKTREQTQQRIEKGEKDEDQQREQRVRPRWVDSWLTQMGSVPSAKGTGIAIKLSDIGELSVAIQVEVMYEEKPAEKLPCSRWVAGWESVPADCRLALVGLHAVAKSEDRRVVVPRDPLGSLLHGWRLLPKVQVYVEGRLLEWSDHALQAELVPKAPGWQLQGVDSNRQIRTGALFWSQPPFIVSSGIAYPLLEPAQTAASSMLRRIVEELPPPELEATALALLAQSGVKVPLEGIESAVQPVLDVELDLRNGVIEVLPSLSYRDIPAPLTTSALPHFPPSFRGVRDVVAERALIDWLQCHARPVQGQWRMTCDRLPSFMSDVDHTEAGSVRVSLSQSLKRQIHHSNAPVDVTVRPSSEGRWFDIQFSCPELPGPVDAQALRQALQSGQHLVPLKGGGWWACDTLPSASTMELLDTCGLDVLDNHTAHLEMWHASALGEHCDDKEVADFCRQIASLAHMEQESDFLPAGFNGGLRPYQKVGLNWLIQLRQLGLHGLLADEMGLGKTIQTIACLAEAQQGPHLIVCPRTLIWNWHTELEKFAPSLRSVPLLGTAQQRAELLNGLSSEAVVIASYTVVQRDIDLLSERQWHSVVLDEAQQIRNPRTLTAQACRQLPADFRLALTGTPVENRLSDLVSVFDFLMPGLLRGIPKDQITSETRCRVAPFLMRRTKQQVLPDLPELTSSIVHCHLADEQKLLYRDIVEAFVAEMDALQERQELSRMHVLAGLTRLKQVCCHPALLGTPDVPSAKMELLLELIDEICEGGNRAVIFSQYVQMLKIIGEQLDERGIGWMQLDGSTRNPALCIEEYNQSETPFLLASIKAGGTGLNITGADRVIHYDLWWNPAVERQATARVHRIGQKNAVHEYKLVAAETLEEKILDIQESKLSLSHELFEEDAGVMDMDWSDVKRMLQL